MCLGIPMQIVHADGLVALCRSALGQEQHSIDLSLTGTLPSGSWVLTHLGNAYEEIDAERAEQITRALQGLFAVMQGEEPGDAFADLQREPQLPEHLAVKLQAQKQQAG